MFGYPTISSKKFDHRMIVCTHIWTLKLKFRRNAEIFKDAYTVSYFSKFPKLICENQRPSITVLTYCTCKTTHLCVSMYGK